MGTVGVFVSEGGLDVEDAASQSVYGRPTDIGDPSATSDNYTIDSYNNIQYHTPADLLPFGVGFKIAYATDLGVLQLRLEIPLVQCNKTLTLLRYKRY